ncbi:MAG: hypothetical protein EAX87_05700 [Candidatus Thorarchaeota archaeon]|nr:hypothetical protein [Candidatus Thorarchaeota archaeon]
MKKEDLIIEVRSLIEFIDQSQQKLTREHDKFQVSLTNTLKLLNEGSAILTNMKGNTEDLKAYIIRASTETRHASLDSYEQLRIRVERLLNLIRSE